MSVISLNKEKWALKRDQFEHISYLHSFNKSSEVVCCLVCVLHCFKIVQVRSSVVPVHYYDIQVFPGQQQLCEPVKPLWWRPRGPEPMDEKGSGSGEVEVRTGGQVSVRHHRTTAHIIPRVQQQLDSEGRSDDCMGKIEICKVLTSLSWVWWEKKKKHRWRQSDEIYLGGEDETT